MLQENNVGQVRVAQLLFLLNNAMLPQSAQKQQLLKIQIFGWYSVKRQSFKTRLLTSKNVTKMSLDVWTISICTEAQPGLEFTDASFLGIPVWNRER